MNLNMFDIRGVAIVRLILTKYPVLVPWLSLLHLDVGQYTTPRLFDHI